MANPKKSPTEKAAILKKAFLAVGVRTKVVLPLDGSVRLTFKKDNPGTNKFAMEIWPDGTVFAAVNDLAALLV